MPTSFSVIVPTHNRPRLIVACLKSLFAQTQPPLEIIVVDDGSGPAVEDALRPYRASIIYLRQKQEGWGSARQRGAQASRGDILVFLDDDCLAPPGWLACYAAGYAEHPDAHGIGGGLRTGQSTNLAGLKQYRGHQDHFNRLNTPLNIHADQAGRVWFTFGGNRSFRREVFFAAAPESWSWYHDDLLIDLRLREMGALIYYDPEAWVIHRYQLSLADRLRAAYRYGRSDARLPDDLPVQPPASRRSWQSLRRDYPTVPLVGAGWYALTQPFVWLARRMGTRSGVEKEKPHIG